jgi:hypothetical protein
VLRKCVYKLQVRIYVRNIYNTSHSYLSLFSTLFLVLFHKIAGRGKERRAIADIGYTMCGRDQVLRLE